MLSSKKVVPELSSEERDMRRVAQNILRYSFKHAFDAAVKRANEKREEIRQVCPSPTHQAVALKAAGDPYEGIKMPVIPNNNRGTKAKPEAVEGRYDGNEKRVDVHYDGFVKELNSFIGKRFSLSRVEPFRERLTEIWGERVNLRLPFQTGLEDYSGSQYMEVVLGRDGNEFTVKGYSQNWSHTNALR